MENKVEENKILPPNYPFLSSPQVSLDRKDVGCKIKGLDVVYPVIAASILESKQFGKTS